jgi:hypothetical protein
LEKMRKNTKRRKVAFIGARDVNARLYYLWN